MDERARVPGTVWSVSSVLRHVLVKGNAPRNLPLHLSGQRGVTFGIVLCRNLKAGFLGEQAHDVSFRMRRVDHEWMAAGGGAAWVVAIQRPVAGLGGEFLMLEGVAQVVAMRDAVAVG